MKGEPTTNMKSLIIVSINKTKQSTAKSSILFTLSTSCVTRLSLLFIGLLAYSLSIIIINIFQGVNYVTADAKRSRVTSNKSLRFLLPTQDGNCPTYTQYRDLINLTDYESCLRGTDVWKPLNDLLGIENLYDCAGIMIRSLGKLFANYPLVPQHCECLGYFDLQYPEYAYNNYKVKHTCQEQDPAFKDIIQRFYLHADQHNQNVMINRGQGGTHHSVWQVLSKVSDSECRNLLIRNLAFTYGGKNTTVTYECHPVNMPLHILTRPSTMPHTTSKPTTSSKSTTKATTTVHRTSHGHVTTIHKATHFHPVTSSSSKVHTSSTPTIITMSTKTARPILHQTTTHAQMTHFHTASTSIYSATLTTPKVATIQITTMLNTTNSTPVLNISSATCSKYRLIHDIAKELIISSLLTCPSKVYSSDQVPLTYCNSSPVTTTWKPGPKVMDTCQSLPLYTPIATFTSGIFNPIIDIAGIFLGCADNSFKIAIALCNAKLHIDHVNVTMAPILHYPDSYHVILS